MVINIYICTYDQNKECYFERERLTTDSTLTKTVPFTFNTHAIFSSQEFYNLKINLDACILLNSCFWVWHKATFYSPIWKLNITANAKTRCFEDLVKNVYFYIPSLKHHHVYITLLHKVENRPHNWKVVEDTSSFELFSGQKFFFNNIHDSCQLVQY